MPNGGSICCNHCVNGDVATDRCSIYATPLSPVYLCRLFRLDGQTSSAAHAQWKVLNTLDPGVVYEIDNSYPASGAAPQPTFLIKRVR